MTFVPVVLAFLGRRSWWLPAWIGRIIPKFDVEPAGVQADTRQPPPVPVV